MDRRREKVAHAFSNLRIIIFLTSLLNLVSFPGLLESKEFV